jgi:hypothetical protein
LCFLSLYRSVSLSLISRSSNSLSFCLSFSLFYSFALSSLYVDSFSPTHPSHPRSLSHTRPLTLFLSPAGLQKEA